MSSRRAWREEVRRELGKREEFKEIMESVPLEDVEVEEKPLMSMLSLGWREAFKNDRAGFLFPEALRAMMTSELATLASCLPMMPGELSQLQSKDAQVLQLRLVSKSVKEAIDDLHSNEAVMSDFPGQFRSVSITYNNLKGATNLTNKFGKDVNPFFFHRLHISQSCYTFQLPEFWKKTEAILARWGKEVWSASIRVSVPPNGYDFLVAYLKLMPNLRRLFISGGFEEMNLNKLEDRIATNHLPELPYLRFVSSDASWSRPSMVAGGGTELESASGTTLIAHSLLTRYSRNLEVIKLDSVPLPEGHFPSLQKLELKLTLVTDMYELANSNILNGLYNWGTPSNELALSELTLVVHGDSVYCHEFLTHVLDRWVLDLHHLETLYLRLFHKFEPLDNGMVDILQPCDHGPDHYWSLPEVDWIFYFLRRSNIYGFYIWQWLPKMKRLKVNISSSGLSKIEEYTRAGYQSYQQHCQMQIAKRPKGCIQQPS